MWLSASQQFFLGRSSPIWLFTIPGFEGIEAVTAMPQPSAQPSTHLGPEMVVWVEG